jgi:DNA-binding transcriptional ArsR family regulator
MDDMQSAESPLEAAGRTVSSETAEAFKLLANETRLAILLALWQEYEPLPDENVSFSRLLERVDHDNRGNFSYHLKKLEGRFVTQHTDRGGYELQTAGLNLVRSIIAGTGIDDVSVDDAELDESCPICDGPTTINYQDGVVLWSCTECAGVAPGASVWGTLQNHMDGELGLTQFEPAGVADRTPAELRAASQVAEHQRARSMVDGLCPTCSGPVDSWLEYCRDHDPDDGCDNCGFLLRLLAHFQCRICEDHDIVDPKRLPLFHPTVTAFYDDHGISTRVQADDLGSARRLFDLMTSHEGELLSEDPLRVVIIASVNDDEVRVTIDETASIVNVSR